MLVGAGLLSQNFWVAFLGLSHQSHEGLGIGQCGNVAGVSKLTTVMDGVIRCRVSGCIVEYDGMYRSMMQDGLST